jgi:GTP pyrophosphokinase
MERIVSNEKNLILSAYKNLISTCDAYLKKEDKLLIKKAFNLSLNLHKDAKRKSGEPYILHPIEVARIVCKEIGLNDVTSLVCALLHDVVEDTFAEIEDIRKEFGDTVAKIIDGLTKISGVFDPTSSEQAENFKKMILIMSDDIRVALIKLADRLHNMRTLEYMKPESQLKIASETRFLYAPLAHRLGLYNIKSELEDLALKYIDPEMYYYVKNKLEENAKEREEYIQKFIEPLKEQLTKIGIKFTIKGRVKSIYSIAQKMQRQGIPFEEVYDIFAVRVVIDSENPSLEHADCWKVYGVLASNYDTNPNRLRDWLTYPKNNGYEALHTTVMGPEGKWVEVQIRSKRMDEEAEMGIAAHWKYKDRIDSQKESKFDQWLNKVRELLNNPQLSAVDFVDEFKAALYTDEIYVFTPKGEIKTLPQGSTVLDFAYEVHTDLGNHCIGAKVNNKVLSFNARLYNGDQVRILTSKKQFPTEEWLQYVKTTKAKNAIKEAIKERKKEMIAKGKEIFQWRLKQMNLQIDENHQVFNELLAYLQIPDMKEFYYRIGTHHIDLVKIQEFVDFKKNNFEAPIPQKINEFEKLVLEKRGLQPDELVMGNVENLNYLIAPCCQPIPGDSIVGFSEANGIYIHRTNCKEAIKIMSNFGSKIVKAKWTEHHDIEFLVSVRMIGQDRMGMLSNIVKVISTQHKKYIRSIKIDTEDGLFDGTIKFYVSSTEEIEHIINNLKKIPGVLNAMRMYS